MNLDVIGKVFRLPGCLLQLKVLSGGSEGSALRLGGSTLQDVSRVHCYIHCSRAADSDSWEVPSFRMPSCYVLQSPCKKCDSKEEATAKRVGLCVCVSLHLDVVVT
eukprot:5450910-Amphidinium_carterae.1